MSVRRSRPGTPAVHDYGTGRSSTARSSARPKQARPARRSKSRDSNTSSRDDDPQGSLKGTRKFGQDLRNSNSLPDVGSSRGSARDKSVKYRRPRPGRKSTEALDIFKADPRRTHELGMWVKKPKYGSSAEMWYKRWARDQPHPSFDVDGDGTVSAMDMFIAREFDKDGNGVLDKDETRKLRTLLAKKGISDYAKIPHGTEITALT
eukprot:COSAG05_NODE_8646_length_685_cov_0.757679_1_plen_205_part_10